MVRTAPRSEQGKEGQAAVISTHSAHSRSDGE